MISSKINNFYKGLIFFHFFLLFWKVSAQDKCGTVLYQQIQEEQEEIKESGEDFEKFIRKKYIQRKSQSNLRTQNNIYQIPVVVHIVHKGENVGIGVNLSVERILSQIRTLNQDFRRQNADTIFTPEQYLDVAADTEIEFVLAKTNPNGFPTSGIVRVTGARSTWNIFEDSELKAQSYWPAEDYLNIWVTDLSSDLLGYSQFPVSDLAGMEFSSNNRLTDGVVIDYEYFGENASISPRSIGRTTTHEVGHYLGLRHIWGDGNCDVDDFCDDTPNARGPNYSCTVERTSCGSRDMFENYMDYTDDQCMNLFTTCQRERMRIVLENSPRRVSLPTSPGLLDPAPVANDGAIRSILSPQVSSCEDTVLPEIELLNTGSNTINSVRIQLALDGSIQETRTFNVNIQPSESQNLSFSSVNFSTRGPYNVEFLILQVNGVADLNQTNNSLERTFYIRTEGMLPLTVDFEEFPDDWLVLNPDQQIGWEIVNLRNLASPAARMEFFRYGSGIGQLDYLLSPSLDLRDLISVTLSFRVAYAAFPEIEEDGLIVAVSKDCGNTFPNLDVLYRKYGSVLATAPPTQNAFIPNSRSQWRYETIDLSAYIGEPNIQIGFIGQNGHGNNLYIDDVDISVKRRETLDVNLRSISSPSLVTCQNNPVPQIEVRNDGRVPLTTFTVNTTLNGSALPDFQYGGPPIQPDETVLLNLPALNLQDGAYQFNVNINNPNDASDDFPEDNEASLRFVIDNTRDILPLRETFDNLLTFANSDWTIVNPDDDITWELFEYSSEGGKSAFIRNFTYDAVGQKDWLVSPVLDLRNLQQASMFFSLAHALNPNFPDELEVRVSTDCGQTYPDIVYQKRGEGLSTLTSTEEWYPTDSSGFRNEFINLSQYTGEENVRIAFVATTGFGNNLFIDNIEFYVSDNPVPVVIPGNTFVLYPNPTTDKISVSLNLAQRQDLTLTLIDHLGRKLSSIDFPNTLNQTHEFDLTGLSAGIYFVRFQGAAFSEIKRFILK